MGSAQWPLHHDRPAIQVVLTLAQGGQKVMRTLLADTGAGAAQDPFEIVLDEIDCMMCGATPFKMVTLGGSYTGIYPIYALSIEIPSLSFKDGLFVAGVAKPPDCFDWIGCFRFLNRFT
jgi:hypothetical protein